MPLISANPAEKGKIEKIAEWVPITGTLITGKDAYLYFKDGKYWAGSIMSAATLVSAVGDVLLFTGIGASGKAGAVVADKALTEAAEQVAKKTSTITAERTIEVAEKVTEKSAIDTIAKTRGATNPKAIKAAINKAVQKVAELPVVEAYDLLPKAEAARIAQNAANIAEKVDKRVKYLLKRPDTAAKLGKMNEGEQTVFVKRLTKEEWKKVAGNEATLEAEKTAVEAVKEATKVTTSKLKKIGTKVKEFSEKKSRTVGIFKNGKYLAATKETPWEKVLVWGGYAPAMVPSTIMDLAGGITKFGIWTGKKVMERATERTAPFVSGLTARKGIGSVGVYVGNREMKSVPKPVEKKGAPAPAAAEVQKFDQKIDRILSNVMNSFDDTLERRRFIADIQKIRNSSKSPEEAYKKVDAIIEAIPDNNLKAMLRKDVDKI